MASFNRVVLVGNLTRDPELRYTPKGMAVAKIGLAVNRVWRTDTGEQKEEVTFVDVDVWGRTAENVAPVRKDPQLVHGRTEEGAKGHGNGNRQRPANGADGDRADRRVVVERLPHADNHRRQHPERRGAVDRNGGAGNGTKNTQDARR